MQRHNWPITPMPSDYSAKRGAWDMAQPSALLRTLHGEAHYQSEMSNWRAWEPYPEIAAALEQERRAREFERGKE